MSQSLLATVAAVRDDLTTSLLEREAAVEAALLALLTGEHVVFLGPPGTAKSLLVRSICERLTGATYFERLLTRFSTPEELFGPLSLAALEQDQLSARYQRNARRSAHRLPRRDLQGQRVDLERALGSHQRAHLPRGRSRPPTFRWSRFLRRQTKRPKKTASMRSTTASCCVMSSRRWPTTAVSNVCSRYSPPPRLRSCRWTSSEPLKPS
jgi:hypothetical protein